MNNKNEDVNNKDKLQTENTNTKNTREKIDNVINKVGSESLNKIGVPKPLADKAIKSGGGKFFPGKSSLTKNFSRNLLAKQINKVTNNNKKETPNDLDEEDLKELEKEEKKESLGESLKETGKDVAKDIIKKKIWTAILSNPYVLGIIIVVAIILIIVLIIVLLISMDFDFVGIGNINPEYYDFSCNQIYLVWENDDYLKKNNLSSTTNPGMVDISNTERFSYKEYDVNSYVTGIVWTDNKNAGDVNNNTVYELMSVAARSRVTRSISSNCVVLRDYNSENFTELNGTEEKYNEIYSAVNKTGGLIIGKDDAIIDAKYDAFSYTKKTNASYYMMNKNERGEQIIPDSWVEENVNINPLNVFNTTYLESLSLYGAKYLLEKPSSQFDLYRTLKEYYGSDIKFYTIGSTENSKLECSSINFYKTPLSRDEFITLVTNYLANKTSTTANLFKQNAGLIYDAGLEMNANPEMVYIVAEKEQGWKDSDFTLRCSNFYGMGVGNGQNTGKCYSSFLEGVKDLLRYVNQKGSLNAFTKTYSYLGTYLANPGSSGDGGCYYLTLEEIYGSNYTRCDASYKCASSNGGSGCVLTTEAEKQAYIDWQSKKITNIRSNIFHLSEEVCTDGSVGSVPAGEAVAVPLSQRMNWLFPNGLPKSQSEILPYITTINVPITSATGNNTTLSLTVHKKLVNEIQAVFTEMANIKFPISSAGGYAYRKMASGTGHLSHHSYGVAIDINATQNPAVYWNYSPDTTSPYYINSRIVAIWKKHGFYWGGDWKGNYYDPMHFTYTNH